LGLATGKAQRAAKILTSKQQQALQGLAGTSFVTRGQGYMVQPNKVDFDVRKLLKRKKVSSDRMALPEHSECCMLHQKMQTFQRRLFYALVCSEDNALIENSKDGVTNNHSNTNIKIVNLTLIESL
jgi:hypothetical protein